MAAASVPVNRALAAAVVLGAGALYATSSSEPMRSLYVSVSSSDPVYVDVFCHLAGINGMATYVALPPITPTPSLPDYMAPRWVGDPKPCGR